VYVSKRYTIFFLDFFVLCVNSSNGVFSLKHVRTHFKKRSCINKKKKGADHMKVTVWQYIVIYIKIFIYIVRTKRLTQLYMYLYAIVHFLQHNARVTASKTTMLTYACNCCEVSTKSRFVRARVPGCHDEETSSFHLVLSASLKKSREN